MTNSAIPVQEISSKAKMILTTFWHFRETKFIDVRYDLSWNEG